MLAQKILRDLGDDNQLIRARDLSELLLANAEERSPSLRAKIFTAIHKTTADPEERKKFLV
jgi:hypothetical protein